MLIQWNDTDLGWEMGTETCITAVLSFTRSSNIRNWEKRGLVQGLESFVMFDYDYLYSLVKCKQHGSTPSSQ